jgi:AcrR family transcriptional regulator
VLTAGSTDVNPNPTKQRIIDATKRCMSRWGMQKSSMNDIAREAGVSRNTLYCHFTNRDQVVAAAMLQAGSDFANRVINHISGFTSARDRVIEGTLFALVNLLDEPYLGLVNSPDLAPVVNRALESTEGLKLIYAIAAKMVEHEPHLQNDIVEIAEVMTRLLLSLTLFKGPVVRDIDETRAFLVRRLLPAVGL